MILHFVYSILIMKNIALALAVCCATTQTIGLAKTDTHKEPKPTPKTQVVDFSYLKIPHVRDYVEKIYPLAVKAEKKTGIPTPVILAMVSLESGYGRSHYAQTRSNHFGIRCFNKGKAGYKRFSSLEECFDGFTNIFRLKRYANLKEIEGRNLETWITAIAKSGYNHRPVYIERVMRMIHFLEIEDLGKIV